MFIFSCFIYISGCASFQPTINAYDAAAITGIKAAEDNNIQLWKVNVCGTPFSAAIRHPEIVPAMKALCLPQGDTANPANLLNGILK